MRITVHYQSLTPNQAEQIFRTLKPGDDPYQLFYRVDTTTGVVMGWFAEEPQPVRP